jgi:hypothetical protein
MVSSSAILRSNATKRDGVLLGAKVANWVVANSGKAFVLPNNF